MKNITEHVQEKFLPILVSALLVVTNVFAVIAVITLVFTNQKLIKQINSLENRLAAHTAQNVSAGVEYSEKTVEYAANVANPYIEVAEAKRSTTTNESTTTSLSTTSTTTTTTTVSTTTTVAVQTAVLREFHMTTPPPNNANSNQTIAISLKGGSLQEDILDEYPGNRDELLTELKEQFKYPAHTVVRIATVPAAIKSYSNKKNTVTDITPKATQIIVVQYNIYATFDIYYSESFKFLSYFNSVDCYKTSQIIKINGVLYTADSVIKKLLECQEVPALYEDVELFRT